MSECECITTGYEVPLRGLKFDLDKDAIRQIVREIVGDSGVTQEEVRQMIGEALEGGGVASRWIAPDYANIETVNRITANNGTWTADRNGYVRLIINTFQTQGTYFYINDVAVFRVSASTGTYQNVIVPVSEGDVVKISTTSTINSGGIGCHFIPPKAV